MNFRSIKNLKIEPQNLCALIGPNSCGKTNVLKAIDLVLGEAWTTKMKVVREFFNDPERPIVIKIAFDEPVKYYDNKGYEQTVSSIELLMELNPEFNAKTTINSGKSFWGQDQFKKNCHFIHIPSERDLTDELRVSEWTMLGKLMKLIYENYIGHYENNADKLREDFEEKIEPAKNFLEKDFSDSCVTFRKFVEKFKEKCEENSAGLANDFKPVLNIYNLNWFYKTLQIHVKEDFPDKYFYCEDVGAGMKNLLMLSIFQTYAELMGGKVIFGIEEPEIYLYPQAQRSLYKNFITLAKNTQVFYATHNPNFVDASRPDDICLLRKSKKKGTFKLEKDSFFNQEEAKEMYHKIYTHFNPERNEMFFAKKNLFVEGYADKILFTFLSENIWGIDLDREGISIISCGGKSGVNYFVGVCRLIGFDNYFAIWDSDDNSYAPRIDSLSNTLKNKKGIEIPGNIEKLLNLPGGEGAEKVKNAYRWALKAKKEDLPNEFGAIEKFLLK